LEFGDSAVIVFKKAEEDGIYLSHIPEHVCAHSNLLLLSCSKLIYVNLSSQLCQWLWPKLLRKLAKEFREVEMHTSLAAITPSLALLACLAMRRIASLTSGEAGSAFSMLI
jgi:hypothetical protein